MADFVSSLTGVQMDNALLDMAEHNSEAWAVGERNGVAVGSDDVTYHNNAQYYAQQAQSIAPASVTEAVRWDVAQTALTDANKQQARENIDAGKNGAWTNPNLLDNPFFRINQRSFTSQDFGSSGNGYTVDRWKGYRSIVTVKSDGTIDFTPNSAAYGIAQYIEAGRLVVGNTYTASVDIGGTIYSWTFVYSATAVYSSYFGTSNRFYHHTNANNSVDFWITGAANTTYNVRSFKLELGTVSTLANDTPPDYGTELAKCMRYFVRWRNDPIGFGYISSNTTYAYIHIPIGVTMRAIPTVSLSGGINLRANGQTLGVSSLSVLNQTQTTGVTLTMTTSGFSSVGAVSGYWNSTSDYIDLSADL